VYRLKNGTQFLTFGIISMPEDEKQSKNQSSVKTQDDDIPSNLTDPKVFIDYLRSSRDFREWNEFVVNITNAHGGRLPKNWKALVLDSGLSMQVSKGWDTLGGFG
jgi:hypothetical protein